MTFSRANCIGLRLRPVAKADSAELNQLIQFKSKNGSSRFSVGCWFTSTKGGKPYPQDGRHGGFRGFNKRAGFCGYYWFLLPLRTRSVRDPLRRFSVLRTADRPSFRSFLNPP